MLRRRPPTFIIRPIATLGSGLVTKSGLSTGRVQPNHQLQHCRHSSACRLNAQSFGVADCVGTFARSTRKLRRSYRGVFQCTFFFSYRTLN